MDMRFGTWNVRSLYRAGYLMTVLRELARYKLDLLAVQEVRREGSGTEPAGEYTFFYGKANGNHYLNSLFFFYVQKRIISTVKRVEFVSDRMPYIILRGRWCHIIVLNIHSPTEDKTDDVKVSFYEELEHVFDNKQRLPRLHMERFSLRKLNDVEGKEQFCVEVSNRFAALKGC
jgi:exonuclease III